MQYDGNTFDAARDEARLDKQLERVKVLMGDGNWRSLEDIATGTQAPTSSVSARLRDLRKTKFGAHTVERRYKAAGVWLYRLAA